jgi:hypothetical protein
MARSKEPREIAAEWACAKATASVLLLLPVVGMSALSLSGGHWAIWWGLELPLASVALCWASAGLARTSHTASHLVTAVGSGVSAIGDMLLLFKPGDALGPAVLAGGLIFLGAGLLILPYSPICIVRATATWYGGTSLGALRWFVSSLWSLQAAFGAIWLVLPDWQWNTGLCVVWGGGISCLLLLSHTLRHVGYRRASVQAPGLPPHADRTIAAGARWALAGVALAAVCAAAYATMLPKTLWPFGLRTVLVYLTGLGMLGSMGALFRLAYGISMLLIGWVPAGTRPGGMITRTG